MNEFIKSIAKEVPNLENDLEELKKVDNLPLKVESNTTGLSEDQTKALDKIINWLKTYKDVRDENLFFSLTGSAGTGKTTLLGIVLKEIVRLGLFRSTQICICAPTHKAKKVIVEKTKWKISETIQSLLGLKLDLDLMDFDINNPQFSQQGERKMTNYKLVIADESSMINADLYSTMVECGKRSGTKILFVGDTKQLNPVKEDSISLSLTVPTHNYHLTQVMRQNANNPLVLLLDTLRDDIEHNTSNYLKMLKANPVQVNDKGEGYVSSGISNDFALVLNITFSSKEFEDNKNYCRYISWTNQSIGDTNKWLRAKVFKKTNTIEVDEVLLSYKTIVDGDDLILLNSDDYIVSEIKDSVINGTNSVSFIYPLKVHIVSLQGIDTDSYSQVSILEREQENYENYKSIFTQLLEKAKLSRAKADWKKFYEFKNEILVIENLNDQYNNLLVKKDIDYGYGITIHKSQGSTYNTVFVNGKDINKNPNDLERKRLWYVALSRASNKAYIII